ncbi:MAG: ABC transporter permease [Anaerolineaceae bacterium]|jgi:ABC-2 type transport system permease protein
MNKTLEVTKYEYLRHVSRPRFWIAVFSIPLAVILIGVLSMVISVKSIDLNPVGYIDEAGLILEAPEPIEKRGFFDDRVELKPFTTQEEARSAAENGQIQAYFVIPKNYSQTYQVNYYFNAPITKSIQSSISQFLRENLIATETIPNLGRLSEGSEISLLSLDGTKAQNQKDWVKIVVPLVAGFLFLIVVLMSGSYLLQAVVEEKENRTMEVMLTSVSPNQLMTGKIVGNIGVGLTQLLIWILIIAIGIFIFRDKIPFLSDLHFSASEILITILLLLPAFIFTGALMATLGATVTDTQESQQVSGLVIMPIIMPYYFLGAIMNDPNGLIAKILSYFPLSAPVATTMRMAFTNLPTAEIVLIIIIQVVFAIFSIWLAGKAFRQGMLQYSKRLKLKDIFAREVSHG